MDLVNSYKNKAVSKYFTKMLFKLKSIKIKGTKCVGIYLQSQYSHAQEQKCLVMFTVGQVLDFVYATQKADFHFAHGVSVSLGGPT